MSNPSSLKSRLVAGGAWVVAGRAIAIVSQLLSTLLLARTMTVEAFGLYGLAFSGVAVGAVVAQFGVQQAVVRLVAAAIGEGRPGEARSAIGKAFTLCALGNAAIAACALLVVAAAPQAWHDARLPWPVAAGALLWLAATSLQLLTAEVFRGLHDFRRATLYGGALSWPLALIALGVCAALGGSITLARALTIVAIATVLGVVVGLVALRRRVVALGPAAALNWQRVIAIALPLAVSGAAAQASGQLDLWAVGALAPTADVGVYFLAVRLVSLVATGLVLVNLIVLPFIAELYARGETERLQRLLRGTATAAGIPAVAVLAFYLAFGEQALRWFGEEYARGYVALALLCVGRLWTLFTGSSGIVLSMTGHQRLLMIITLTSLVATAAASWWATAHYGIVGAAAAASAAAVAQQGAQWIAARRATGLWTHASPLRWAELRRLLARSD